jgi:3-hydroxyacyl-CoA dehydrogenase
MYEQKYATREDLDAAMRFGCGYPMGPLALMDLIGLDTAYEILDTMYHQGRDRLHAPSPIIKQMVNAGLKGRKSGRGFYTYAAPGSSEVVADGQTPKSGAAEDPGLAKIPRSAWSAPARWPLESSRSSPRPASTCLRGSRPGQGRRGAGVDQEGPGPDDRPRQA